MKRFRHKRTTGVVRVGAEPPEKIPIRIERTRLQATPPAKHDAPPTIPEVRLGDAEVRQLWQSFEAVTMELEFAAAVTAATKERHACEKTYWATVLSARDATIVAQTQLLQRLCTTATSQNMHIEDTMIFDLAPFVDPAQLRASSERASMGRHDVNLSKPRMVDATTMWSLSDMAPIPQRGDLCSCHEECDVAAEPEDFAACDRPDDDADDDATLQVVALRRVAAETAAIASSLSSWAASPHSVQRPEPIQVKVQPLPKLQLTPVHRAKLIISKVDHYASFSVSMAPTCALETPCPRRQSAREASATRPSKIVAAGRTTSTI